MSRWIVAAILLGVGAPSARAGVYSPDEPVPFKVGPDGPADEIPFPLFKAMLVDRVTAANPATPYAVKGPNGWTPTPRGQYQVRVFRRWLPAKRLPVGEQAGLAADLIAVGAARDAVHLLEPRARDRVPDFRAVATLAHAHAAQGEWDEATRCHGVALFDAAPPDELPGCTPAQVKWVLGVERTYYRRWLQLRRLEAANREPPEEQDVYPLFPAAEGAGPVRFVNDQGRYEPGSLAAAERARLPPDAVAVVQQMLLWSPTDTRMLWLLAELYAAAGRLRDADDVFDMCAWGRGFTNRKRLMDHRAAVREAVARLPQQAPAEIALPDATPAPADNPAGQNYLPDRSQVIVAGVAFGLVAAALAALQVRALLRRRGRAGPRR